MKTPAPNLLKFSFWSVLAAAVIFTASCVYDEPISASPTSNINERLVGNWQSADEQNTLRIRKWDANHYVVGLNEMVMKGYHSEIEGQPFVSVQELETNERKYSYVRMELSEDGNQLTWQSVSIKAVPADSGSPAAALRKKLNDPGLLTEKEVYKRVHDDN